MSSRRDQREALRREREAAAAAAAAAMERRRRLAAYGVAGALAVLIAIGAVVFIGGGEEGDPGLYPEGAELPRVQAGDLTEAAQAAGCELRTVRVASREHVPGSVDYPTKPPAGGDHLQVPAEDGVYTEGPQAEALVHSLEHGRVVIWFKRRVRPEVRGHLKALLDDDSYQQVLTPDPTRMEYAVAATAWNREPEPLGTGRVLGCEKANDLTYAALAAFRDEHRGNGPEPVP